MRITDINQVKKGLIVKLTHPKPAYTLGPSNPAVGTEWETTGEIIAIGLASIGVRWKNGKTNSYSIGTLSIADGIPEGNFESIWE